MTNTNIRDDIKTRFGIKWLYSTLLIIEAWKFLLKKI